ncbi:MAG: type IV-A pilus assembly ATPase PilB [Candidatus Competibacteraceae bacterium]
MATTTHDVKTTLVGTTGISLGGLARLLVNSNVLNQEAALKAVEEARKADSPFVSYLIENKLTRAVDIARVASRGFNLPLFDVSALEIDPALIQSVDDKLIRRHRALPLYKRGNRLFVGLSDPTNTRALEDIKFQTGLNTEPIIVVDAGLNDLIERALDNPSEAMDAMLDDDLDNIDISAEDEGKAPDAVTQSSDEDAPIVRFVNKLLLDAINKGASDLHFEPYEKYYRVRFRQDGILHEVAKPPINLAPRMSARIKVMSQLDIAERRVPQDGRFKMALSKRRAIDFRVNTLPTLYGEKVVMRILDPTTAQIGVDALGFEPEQKKWFMETLHKPQGMVLVTGPTGSGKTVTLYTGLNILNTSEVNISTAEDPIEIQVAGINQVNVNTKTGMTFANALRAFLRQDPDIIMVGEIRDLETAEISIKAAQTGHMVLSTVHTNSAPETLTRLMNMGVAPFNIASSINLIIAQRLARRLCLHCKEEEKGIPYESLLQEGFQEDELDKLELYKPVGCDQCTRGYKGRLGIFEVMPVSEEMGRLIMANGNSMQIADQAQREGIKDLRQAGLDKVRAGLTSLAEINRVTKD